MARHVMTPARRAALRKAQLASARKRRKGGGARRAISRRGRHASSGLKSRYTLHVANVSKETARKRKYDKKYTGPGGIARRHEDMKRSKGAYSRNYRGRKIGKKEARLNRVSSGVLMAQPSYGGLVIGSRIRGRRHAKKKAKR